MSHPYDICIATGIFPPDTGGPAKFAESFIEWGKKHRKNIAVVSLTNASDSQTGDGSSLIKLISRNRSFLSRFTLSVLEIRKMMKLGVPVLANGMFLESLVAYISCLFRGNYSCKIPGDIVWERARNSGATNLNINQYQESQMSFRYRVFRMFFSLSLKKANFVIVPSAHLKDLALSWGVNDTRLRLIYNSVDQDLYSKSSKVSSNYDVVTVCRLVSWKGVDEVIKVCSKLGLSLLVVGDGPERSKLESLAASLEAKVVFLGEKSPREIPEIIHLASAFVLNSSFEATSYALLEARSAGLFSIARANTGSEEVIHSGFDGILCGDGESQLEDALRLFRDDKEFVLHAIARAKADSLNRFNQDTNFMQIFNLVSSDGNS